MPQLSMHSPIGDLAISEEDGAIVAVDWGWGAEQAETRLLGAAKAQLDAYFDGERRAFDLPLAPRGSPPEQRVWDAMRAIPYGASRTYGDIADEIGLPAQAVGQACGANPIPILIPCHRVLAADGLGGFSADGGVETKAALLRLEGALMI